MRRARLGPLRRRVGLADGLDGAGALEGARHRPGDRVAGPAGALVDALEQPLLLGRDPAVRGGHVDQRAHEQVELGLAQPEPERPRAARLVLEHVGGERREAEELLVLLELAALRGDDPTVDVRHGAEQGVDAARAVVAQAGVGVVAALPLLVVLVGAVGVVDRRAA